MRCSQRRKTSRLQSARPVAAVAELFPLDRSAYAGCTKIYRGSNFRRRLDGCRLDLPSRRQCLPLAWGSVGRSLSAVRCSPTIAESLGARCHDFSPWLDRDCTCSASYSHPWIRFVLCRATQEVVGCYRMVLVRHGRRGFCGFCTQSAARKRCSSRFAKFRSTIAHWHRHHGDDCHNSTSLDRFPTSEAGFPGQAVLALFYSVFRGGGGGFSRCSGFTRLSASKRWSGEWFALAFGNLCLRSVGDLAFAYSSHFQRIGICSGDPICDRCSHFIRSASFVLLASERYVSLTGSGTCSG